MADPWRYPAHDVTAVGVLHAPTGPANDRAILIVHEADGIGGNVRRHAGRLAEQGYLVAAADMHGDGRVLAGGAIAAALDRFRADPNLLRGRIGAALTALQEASGCAPDRIAAIGYCFGGWAVLELARSGANLAAVASFHGLLTTARPAKVGTIKARVLVCTGDRDPLVPPAQVAAFQDEMRAAGADWQLVVHGGALHSFTNVDVDKAGDPRMAYDADADRLSWAALHAHLEGAFAAS